MLKAGVIGDPIGQSRSPLIHQFWLKEYNIEGCYDAHHVSRDELPHFISTLSKNGFCGCNVTIPHKETVFQLAQNITDEARSIGAANTLWLENGTVCATNTDAYGFGANLDQFAKGWDDGESALVIGAGGAARAIIYSLIQRKFSTIFVANRSIEKAQILATQFGTSVHAIALSDIPDHLKRVDFLVNTSSMGMMGKNDLDLDLSVMSASAVVSDAVYNPLQTKLLLTAHKCGLRNVDGLGMLLHQAVPGFEIWFGTRPKVTKQLREMIIRNIFGKE